MIYRGRRRRREERILKGGGGSARRRSGRHYCGERKLKSCWRFEVMDTNEIKDVLFI